MITRLNIQITNITSRSYNSFTRNGRDMDEALCRDWVRAALSNASRVEELI